jgi:hypothetical protein
MTASHHEERRRAALMELRMAELRVLAAETALAYGREQQRRWLASSNSMAARVMIASLKQSST